MSFLSEAGRNPDVSCIDPNMAISDIREFDADPTRSCSTI